MTVWGVDCRGYQKMFGGQIILYCTPDLAAKSHHDQASAFIFALRGRHYSTELLKQVVSTPEIGTIVQELSGPRSGGDNLFKLQVTQKLKIQV